MRAILWATVGWICLLFLALVLLHPASRPALASPSPGVLPERTEAPTGRPSPRDATQASGPSPSSSVAGSSPKPTRAPATARPSRVPSIADARAYALSRLGRTQFACLDALVARESRWRINATNRTSGAYGLPQALPGSKMAKYGADWRVNPIVQLTWMISYVNGRYGSACAALHHALDVGWY